MAKLEPSIAISMLKHLQLSVGFTSSTSENWDNAKLLYSPGSTLTTAIVKGTSTFGGLNLMKQDNGNCKERAKEVYVALKYIIEDYSKFINSFPAIGSYMTQASPTSQ